MNDILGVVPWFPQEYAETFYLLKGLLAVTAVVMVVGHMMHTWEHVAKLGQRLRYFALLTVTALIAFASGEQVQEDVLVSYRNLGALVATLVVIVAMSVSIREDMRR